MAPDLIHIKIIVRVQLFSAPKIRSRFVGPVQPVQAPAVPSARPAIPGVQGGTASEPFHGVLSQTAVVNSRLPLVMFSPFLCLYTVGFADFIGNLRVFGFHGISAFQKLDPLRRKVSDVSGAL